MNMRTLTHAAAFASICLAAPCGADDTITVENLGPGLYRLTFQSSTVLTVEGAQERLEPHAVALCAGQGAYLGHYEFRKSEPIPGQAGAESPSFELKQDVGCGDAPPAPATQTPDDPSFGVVRKDASQSLEAFIRAASVEYLDNRARGAFEQAYARYSGVMRGFSPFAQWRDQNAEFNGKAGKLKSVTVWRVTVYDNSPGAPQPGIYVAADYENVYENVPFQCGYLMWFGVSEDRFVVTREETGTLPPEILASIPPDQLPQVRKQFFCKP